ncbi:MAG TPA: S8 family serine peptidase [Burkholderiaceae bacterium]|nr:S8 family serine peptidase [Burkholderiaceae bacterium]
MNLGTRRFLALAAALLSGAAHAQLRLPSLGSTLSPITQSPLLQRVEPLVDNVLAPVDLASARLDEIAARARAHRRELDRDPRGELIVRAELLAQPSGRAARDALLAAGFQPLREDALDGLDDEALLVLKAPPGVSLADALARARALDPAGAYDFHHVYTGSGGVGAASPNAAAPAPPPVVRPASANDAALQVGLIDSGVDASHPAFRHASVRRHGCSDGDHPAPHGTAVASLMVGEDARFESALPHAVLVAGDVYCDAPTGGSVEAIARELAWMARQKVAVVNISLVGPANQILQRLVERAVAQGVLVVAAVGNDGPAAPPLYPASWPGVVGVGAVDGRLRLLAEGARGPQVMFVAPGADMAAAASGTRAFAPVRGTSFAAPFVAGLLAANYQAASPEGARAALARLAGSARDLPQAPRDGIGRGLVAEKLRTPPDDVELARAR